MDENLNDELIVTVIATGFDKEKDEPVEDTIRRTIEEEPEDEGDTDIPAFLRKRVF